MASRNAGSGFTLLEVLVALIIFAIAFGAIAGIFQTALRQSTTAETLDDARALAEQQIARFGTELPLKPIELAGQSAAGYLWRAHVELAAPIPGEQTIALYRVTVDVGADDNDRHYVTLQTLRIGSAP